MSGFLTELKTSELVTLLGVMFTLFVGVINILISSHKSRLEGITQNRMKWINSVRELAGKITSWRYDESLKELRQDINLLILYLNVSNSIDNKIIERLLKMYDTAYELSFYGSLKSTKAQKLFEDFYSYRQTVRTLMRIYLKKEWTRVKAESKVWKMPFCLYWIPFLGFSEKWATASLTRKFEKVNTYDFEPWMIIDLADDMSIDKQYIIENDGDLAKIPSELVNMRRQMLRRKLTENDVTTAPDEKMADNIPLSIVVPDGKLAGGMASSIVVPDGKNA